MKSRRSVVFERLIENEKLERSLSENSNSPHAAVAVRGPFLSLEERTQESSSLRRSTLAELFNTDQKGAMLNHESSVNLSTKPKLSAMSKLFGEQQSGTHSTVAQRDDFTTHTTLHEFPLPPPPPKERPVLQRDVSTEAKKLAMLVCKDE
jgi:hypothetical protein